MEHFSEDHRNDLQQLFIFISSCVFESDNCSPKTAVWLRKKVTSLWKEHGSHRDFDSCHSWAAETRTSDLTCDLASILKTWPQGLQNWHKTQGLLTWWGLTSRSLDLTRLDLMNLGLDMRLVLKYSGLDMTLDSFRLDLKYLRLDTRLELKNHRLDTRLDLKNLRAAGYHRAVFWAPCYSTALCEIVGPQRVRVFLAHLTKQNKDSSVIIYIYKAKEVVTDIRRWKITQKEHHLVHINWYLVETIENFGVSCLWSAGEHTSTKVFWGVTWPNLKGIKRCHGINQVWFYLFYLYFYFWTLWTFVSEMLTAKSEESPFILMGKRKV